ncbi:hypothetical protein PMIN02_008149, partial [Paraphaeosphaeria minitans]
KAHVITFNHELNENSKRDALYAETRFAKIEDDKSKFLDILDGEDPVILVGAATPFVGRLSGLVRYQNDLNDLVIQKTLQSSKSITSI